MNLGINLDWAKDWSQTIIFNDYMKQASRFGARLSPWIAGGILLDSNGMPLEDFGFVVYRRAALEKPLKLTLYYRCNGGNPVIESEHGNITITQKSKDLNTNITKVNLTVTQDTAQLFLKFRYTNGGIDFLELYEEGTENDGTFHKDFLELIKGFKTYRYMEILRTNNSTVINWEDRTLPKDICQDYKGIAWEYVIELSNITKTDLWINIPHLASDDYCIKLANMLKNGLLYNQNIYIEYSNELWNGTFTQAGWVTTTAETEVNSGNSNLNTPVIASKYNWGYRVGARRIREISYLFKSVWGNEMNKRVRPLLSGWGVVIHAMKDQLNYLTTNYSEPVSTYIWGICTGCYAGEGAVKNTSTFESTFIALENMVDNFEENWHFKFFYDKAKEYGLRCAIYEGGLDLQQNLYRTSNIYNENMQNIFKEQRSEVLLTKFINSWFKSTNDDLFCFYKVSVGDVWSYAFNRKDYDMANTTSYVQKAIKKLLKYYTVEIKKGNILTIKSKPKKSGIFGIGLKIKNIKRGKR